MANKSKKSKLLAYSQVGKCIEIDTRKGEQSYG